MLCGCVLERSTCAHLGRKEATVALSLKKASLALGVPEGEQAIPGTGVLQEGRPDEHPQRRHENGNLRPYERHRRVVHHAPGEARHRRTNSISQILGAAGHADMYRVLLVHSLVLTLLVAASLASVAHLVAGSAHRVRVNQRYIRRPKPRRTPTHVPPVCANESFRRG